MSCRKARSRDAGGRTRYAATAGLIVIAIVAATFGARAELPEWGRNVESTGRFHDALFRTVPMPAGSVEVRRAPADAYDALARMSGGAADRELLGLRARLAEEKLDAAAAEIDWQAYASSGGAAGQIALADFYHRRLLPQKEADALAAAALAPDTTADRLLPVPQRTSWRAFERIMALVDVQQLPDAFAEAEYRAWMRRDPGEEQPYVRLFAFLVSRDRTSDAEALLTAFQRALPSDQTTLLSQRAELAVHRGATADALAVYDQAFQPTWDPGLVQGYFALLERTHNLRAFLDRARQDVAARPADLTPVARLFFYYQHAGNIAAAERALADFETRRDSAPRTADELFTLARLYEATRNQNEALRYYASIYSLPDATPADAERALATIITVLFTAPEQPLRFGSGDLSFYRDIATLDRYPGFLNGILSLLFNSAAPADQYARQDSASASYFHRTRAVDLLALFETRFPSSPRRAELNALLIAAYAGYGVSDAVIDRGQRFLTTFPNAPERTTVALAMADAFAQVGRVSEEFATYDRILQELAINADRVPLGVGTTPQEDRPASAPVGARSPQYARVLDRYIARLVSRKQLPDALAVYRREIDRNPADPGLYAATAQFLGQNDFTTEVEQVYRLAIQQFPDHSWHHRLARWYLRQREAAAFEALTRDATRTFDGTELARYFQGVVHPGPDVNEQMYLQLNLYAHERFPHHLIFVRNLLAAYSTRGTLDAAAHEALLARHWFEDDQLTALFFATLSSANRLDAEVAAVRALVPAASDGNWARLAKDNPAGAQFLAEADIWRSRFESGTPILSALAAEFPSDLSLNHRSGSLHRSLSYADPREIDAAAQAEERLARFDPRDTRTPTTLGEIYADRDRIDRSRAYWNRLADIEPGNAAGYLDSATVFWDYYQFDDALRVMALGRTRLHNPALYAYEAGAIQEGLRQPARVVDEYVRGALAGASGAPAQARLLKLATRQAYRALADTASAAAANGNTPSEEAVALRIAVLGAQSRRADQEQFLLGLLNRTSSLELMTDIAAHASRLGFESVRTRALARQIEVMSDPIDKLQLRAALVQLYESRGDLDLARKTTEAIYAEDPKILGVVRQTADFYWRHNLRREAIGVLTRAASSSYPALQKQFVFEASAKSIQAGDYAAGRDLLKPLLAADPFNADYLAAVAQSYALARDDRSLRDFYMTTMNAMRSASMPADERTARIATLRRGLIPALTRLSGYSGAVDQYIEVINKYPDDDALLREAGLYARQHARTDQLVAYYTKTAADSPRDYRWPMLLARLETQFEDFPAAIAAYGKATAIRPDRADFFSARGDLEERLMRFDNAVDSFGKTYELTYHDRQWMAKIAELRARQGNGAEAAKALRIALVEGRPEAAAPFFSAARRLAEWRLLDQAKSFVDEGARLADPEVLLETGDVYVSVYTGLRQSTTVLDRLLASEAAATTSVGNRAAGEVRAALNTRLAQMGDIVFRDYTPEEKTAFAAELEKKTASRRGYFEELLLPLAEHAGLSELTVQWQTERLRASLRNDFGGPMSRLVQLQTERLRFADLAQELERDAEVSGPQVNRLRIEAANAYRKAGDPAAELRLLSRVPVLTLDGAGRARYFELLLARDPQRLVTLAGTGPVQVRDAVANYVVGHGTGDQALAIVRARGKGLPPVWTNAYIALVGLHFARFDAGTTDAFAAALGSSTIAEQLMPVDRSLRLAGDTWFAYASRFGEFRAFAKQPGADDYLPAGIERTPARSDSYVSLADFYRDEGPPSSALAEYEHAATLNAGRSDVHLRAAAILWRQGQRAAAIARWRQALNVLADQATRATVPTAPLVSALDAISSRKLWPELHEPADKMVRAYVTRNGTYRVDALLRATFRAAGEGALGTDALLALAPAAPSPVDFLGFVVKASWLPDPQRDRVYERIGVASEEVVAQTHGDEQSRAQVELDSWRILRIRSLVDTKQPGRADPLLRGLPDRLRAERDADVTELDARIASANGTLDALLDRYSRDENRAVNIAALRTAATTLRRTGDTVPARRIMEFVYMRQLANEELTPPLVLGLAEIRIQQGNLPAALELLRRLSLAVGAPFDNLAACGALLDRLNHPAEALEFRKARVQAVPWDAAAQLALARTEIAAAADRAGALDRLGRIADSPIERYTLRVEAARAFGAAGGRLGRQPRLELEWLRTPTELTPAAANQPMFVAARVAAAQQTTEPATRVSLLLAAVAVDPHDTSLRVPLFRAETAAGKLADAIEAVQPIVRRNRTLANTGLPAADRLRFAREMGDAHQQADQLQEAARFFTIALEGQTAPARAALRTRIAAINNEISRRARNLARQPQIGEALDQPQLVRPRIPGRVAVVAPDTTAAQGAAR